MNLKNMITANISIIILLYFFLAPEEICLKKK